MTRETDFGSVILAQARPTNTSTATLYSPPTNRRAKVSKIMIANTTASPAAASIFADVDGTTFDQTTAILYAKSIAANDSETIDFDDGMELADAGTIGCQSGTSSALTYTVLGRLLDTP